jgi:hypothetical protein
MSIDFLFVLKYKNQDLPIKVYVKIPSFLRIAKG